MPSLLTPRRRRGREYLDEPGVDARVVRRSLADVARANALFGGTRAVLVELRIALCGIRSRPTTMLVWGQGMATFLPRAHRAPPGLVVGFGPLA